MTAIFDIKKFAYSALADLAAATPSNFDQKLAAVYHSHASWRGSHPLNELHGWSAIAQKVWLPLIEALPDLERRDVIFVGGRYDDKDFVAAVGHYCGTFKRDWLTIPATGRPVYLRYGEVHEFIDGKIIQSTVLFDVLDMMRQAGVWPVAPSLGVETPWPSPLTADGVILAARDPATSAACLAQTLAMHKTLGDYDDTKGLDRGSLLAMPQKAYWHPKMMWYGPGGIGTTRGLSGFVDYHQIPFRRAFPNRKGGNHFIRIGDGHYSVTGGWPSIHARHLGGGFMGLPPTGRDVTMRVMDFYLHHEGLIRENWVPIDILHLLWQMGIDVIARMRRLLER